MKAEDLMALEKLDVAKIKGANHTGLDDYVASKWLKCLAAWRSRMRSANVEEKLCLFRV
jgi:hypothetical protein